METRRLAAPVTALVIMVLTLAACSSAGSTAVVTIKSSKYDPDPVTVSVGDSITWTNEDPVGHTATATDDSFDTSIFFPDESATVTFDAVGTFPYFCGTHPEMVGTVIVEPAK